MSATTPIPPPWQLPPDEEALEAARDLAARRGELPALVALRDLEGAARALPRVVDGAHRTRLLAADLLATVWEGWDGTTGERVILRCLRPRFRDDPVMHRALADDLSEGVPGLHRGSLHLQGDWPHRRLVQPGIPLGEVLPPEDPADEAEVAWLLGRGLGWLSALHGRGRVMGGAWGGLVSLGSGGPQLAWLGHAPETGSPTADLHALATLTCALDPAGRTTAARLCQGWLLEPPPSAADGATLLHQALAAELLAGRHRLARSARGTARRSGATHLRHLVQRLTQALPPPIARACLHASHGGTLTLVECDGSVVRGGLSPIPHPQGLPPLLSEDGRLQARPARRLLRAWATRSTGDEARRQEVQRLLGSTDAQAGALVRWLSARARLRAARLLLDQEVQGRLEWQPRHPGA